MADTEGSPDRSSSSREPLAWDGRGTHPTTVAAVGFFKALSGLLAEETTQEERVQEKKKKKDKRMILKAWAILSLIFFSPL